MERRKTVTATFYSDVHKGVPSPKTLRALRNSKNQSEGERSYNSEIEDLSTDEAAPDAAPGSAVGQGRPMGFLALLDEGSESESETGGSQKASGKAMGFLELIDEESSESEAPVVLDKKQQSPRRVPSMSFGPEQSGATTKLNRWVAMEDGEGETIQVGVVDVVTLDEGRYFVLEVHLKPGDSRISFRINRSFRRTYEMQAALQELYSMEKWPLPRKAAPGEELMPITQLLRICCSQRRYFRAAPFVDYINPKESPPVSTILESSKLTAWLDVRYRKASDKGSGRIVGKFKRRFVLLCRDRLYAYMNDTTAQEPHFMMVLEFSRFLLDEEDESSILIEEWGRGSAAVLRGLQDGQRPVWLRTLHQAAAARTLQRYVKLREKSIVDTSAGKAGPEKLPDRLEAVHPQPSLRAEYYEEDRVGETVVFKKDGSLKGATPCKIVDKMLDKRITGHKTILSFLLTFHAYLPPMELLDQLMSYYLQPPGGDQQHDDSGPMSPFLIRLVSLLQKWIETAPKDFISDPELAATLLGFIATMKRESVQKKLNLVVSRKLRGDAPRVIFSGGSSPRKLSAQFKVSRKSSSFRLLESRTLFTTKDLFCYSCVEVAEQMTLVDFRLFSSVRFSELQGQAWAAKGDEKYVRAPRLMALIDSFNRVSRMISSSILGVQDCCTRASLVAWWIDVGEACVSLNNFNAVMAVTGAFGGAPISRLRKTWAHLKMHKKASWEKLERLRELMGTEKNFQKLRDTLHRADPPLVPYTGVMLSDLTFIDQGNSTYIKTESGERVVNWEKCLLQSSVVEEIRLYQLKGYSGLTAIPALQFVLLNVDIEPEEAMYARSLALEERTPK